jgi:hypothetical protein
MLYLSATATAGLESSLPHQLGAIQFATEIAEFSDR